jgi:hypothetical protein
MQQQCRFTSLHDIALVWDEQAEKKLVVIPKFLLPRKPTTRSKRGPGIDLAQQKPVSPVRGTKTHLSPVSKMEVDPSQHAVKVGVLLF